MYTMGMGGWYSFRHQRVSSAQYATRLHLPHKASLTQLNAKPVGITTCQRNPTLIRNYLKNVTSPWTNNCVPIAPVENSRTQFDQLCVHPFPQVEFRVGHDPPMRPVEENIWLRSTGPLPLAYNYDSSRELNYDSRSVRDGGCDSPSHFEGCRVCYVKVCISENGHYEAAN